MSPVDGYRHVFEGLSMRLLCVPLFSWYFLADVNYYKQVWPSATLALWRPVGSFARTSLSHSSLQRHAPRHAPVPKSMQLVHSILS